MLSVEEYRRKKAEDMDYARAIVDGINADPRPGVLYKESRPITDVRHMIVTSVELFGDNVAFRQKYGHDGLYQTITYREMLRRMNALGTELLAQGFGGERIGVVGVNCSEWAIAYLAVLNGVGVVCPLDKELHAGELEEQCVRAGISCVICGGEKLEKTFRQIIDGGRTKIRRLIRMDTGQADGEIWSQAELIAQGQQRIDDGDRAYLDAQIDATAMSILLFTSGTTGTAKGVMLSHRNIAVDLMISPTVLKVNPWDVFFSVLPLHHTYECTSGFLIPLYKGASIAYCEGLKYITRNMAEAHPTMFLAVPAIFEAIYKRIWRTARKAGKDKVLRRAIKLNNALKKVHIDLSRRLFKDVHAVFGGRMRELICGGAAISPDTLRGLRDFGFVALQGYGLTECAPMGAINPDQMPRDTALGYPFPSMQVKVMYPDEDGIGEFWIKGGNVMLGYYEDPEATAAAIEDGWFKTGDLGYLDEDGYMVMTGRRKNVIITKNGKNVFPEELEFYLSEIPLISESMVFADSTANEEDTTIAAVIRLDPEEVRERCPDADDAELEARVWEEVDRVNAGLPFFKRIKRIILRRDEFVKNTSNKIIRFAEENRRA
ncbi:MAG: AMP-dependent synthetase/ligase [Anaerovoracaceae bacterium]|jgi:long-chain acyl-CoA synthetase